MSIKNNDNVFSYCLSLGDDYELDDVNKLFTAITFDISRYRKYTHTLIFDTPVTEKMAVLEVEKWLSADASEEYYNFIKEDIYEYNSYGKPLKKYHFIGGAYFLEIIERISRNHIKLSCGS